jgi:hypothetical protein
MGHFTILHPIDFGGKSKLLSKEENVPDFKMILKFVTRASVLKSQPCIFP